MIEHDVIVVGAGGAGLAAAIAAHEAGSDVAIVTKLHPVRSHTGGAEGGINAPLPDSDSATLHAYDTMKGADFLGDAPGVETFCRETPRDIVRLEHWGLPFARDGDGRLQFRFLAGHSTRRTTYAGAETGHHLLHTMYEQVVKRGIRVYTEWYVTRLAVTGHDRPEERTCHGVVAYHVPDGELGGFRALEGTILATGGIGQIYDHTTNAVSCTGDGQAMAYRAGAALEDLEFVQFHPTTLPSTGVLISEGVRGEGGRLINAHGDRFMFEHGYANRSGELASRDVVSRAELLEVEAGRGVEDEYVYLDMRQLGPDRITDRLENILHLAEDFEGVDALVEPIPVKPGQHFSMGGIEVDENGQTCIDGLYAAGECACVSVHGANRLGGNALPELVVFGRRAGEHAAGALDAEPSIATGRTSEAEPGAHDSLAAIDRDDATDGDGGTITDPETILERAVEAERDRIVRLLDREGSVGQAWVRDRLQQVVGLHVNVFRRRTGLERTLSELAALRRQYRSVSVSDPSSTFNTELQQTIELRNLIDIAEVVTASALAREESRGAHWRHDYPERDDERWLKHTFVSWNGGSPTLWHKPVMLSGDERTYEPTVRRY